MKRETEYSYVDIIGGTFLDVKSNTEKFLEQYYHKSEVKTVCKLLDGYKLHTVVDLGCSIGAWYHDFKKMGFQKIIGVDISKERLEYAKKRYDETYCCNAYDTPFTSNSIDLLISNNVLVHVLQDEDKIKIFKEVNRIMTKNGVYLFGFTPTYAMSSVTQYCKTNSVNEMKKLVESGGLKVKKIIPCYYTSPRIGANPKFAMFSTKFIYPFTDIILRKFDSADKAKVVYFLTTK